MRKNSSDAGYIVFVSIPIVADNIEDATFWGKDVLNSVGLVGEFEGLRPVTIDYDDRGDIIGWADREW